MQSCAAVLSGDIPSADLFAAGVLLYVIMAGNLPFDEPSLPALFKKIAKAAYPVPTWFTPNMVSLFKAMLNPDPHRRCCYPPCSMHTIEMMFNSS